MPLLSRPPLRDAQGVEVRVEPLIDDIALHGGAAGTAPRPFQGVRQFFMQAALSTIFETHAATGRQQGGGQLGIEGFEFARAVRVGRPPA